jgi:hypothetical protein
MKVTAADLRRAKRIASAMRNGKSTIGRNGESTWGGRPHQMPFHRPGSPYGGLSFDPNDCAEAGRLFLSLLSKLEIKE